MAPADKQIRGFCESKPRNVQNQPRSFLCGAGLGEFTQRLELMHLIEQSIGLFLGCHRQERFPEIIVHQLS